MTGVSLDRGYFSDLKPKGRCIIHAVMCDSRWLGMNVVQSNMDKREGSPGSLDCREAISALCWSRFLAFTGSIMPLASLTHNFPNSAHTFIKLISRTTFSVS